MRKGAGDQQADEHGEPARLRVKPPPRTHDYRGFRAMT
ncbi:MAG: hypothetical protein ACJASX_002997 [Limisphaerales bacterium]|jgi:hypothetical protein